jgi:hypothetical protein
MGSAERTKAVGAESAPVEDPPPGPLDGLGVGSGPPLLCTVCPNPLGVCLLPDVWPQGVVIRLTSQEPIEDVLRVHEYVEVVAVCTVHEPHEIHPL